MAFLPEPKGNIYTTSRKMQYTINFVSHVRSMLIAYSNEIEYSCISRNGEVVDRCSSDCGIRVEIQSILDDLHRSTIC